MDFNLRISPTVDLRRLAELVRANKESEVEQVAKNPEHYALAEALLGPEGKDWVSFESNLQEGHHITETFASFYLVNEEAPAVSITGGAIDNTVVPIKPRKKSVVPDFSEFAGTRVYHVDHDTYTKCVKGKNRSERFAKFIGDDDLLGHVRDYAKRKPSSSIMVKCNKTGGHVILKRGKAGSPF